MEHKRFIIAMVLSALVIIFWQMMFAPPPRPVQPDNGESVVAQRDVPAAPTEEARPRPRVEADPEADDPEAAPARPAAPVRDIAQRTDRLVSPNFTLELTNRGAAVSSILITDPAQYKARGDLLDAFPADSPYRPFTVSFVDENLGIAENAMYEVIEAESVRDGSGAYQKITYRYADPRGRFTLDKVIAVHPERAFVLTMDVKISNHLADMRLVDTMAVNIYGYPDPDQDRSWLDFQPDELEAVCRTVDDTERRIMQKLNGPRNYDGMDILWGAVDTRYFLLGNVPLERGQSCVMEVLNENMLRTRIIGKGFSVAPNQTFTSSHLLYIGPKDFDYLRAAGHRLEDAVDYGFFTILARPLRRLLVLFYGWVGNWGIAIILLTLLIKILTWPITDKAYSSAERMKKIQPKLQELKEKYANDQQRMTEETMKVFKENNVSPLGCLPMLIQIPILYALFVMIYNSVELYRANFALWYTDLSAPDPYFVLPILMGAVMVVQQRMTTIETPNPQMAMMMKIMPIMFTAFMLFLPAGLVLYYFVNLILGLAQQFWIKRKFRLAEEAQGA
jgi:YidC/Oxa1 family membrane protein insertase